jgi:hypothetical protein
MERQVYLNYLLSINRKIVKVLLIIDLIQRMHRLLNNIKDLFLQWMISRVIYLISQLLQ